MEQESSNQAPQVIQQPTRPPRAIQRLPWKLAAIIGPAVLFVPILIAIFLIQVTGASLLDGLFGIYTNTPFQNFVLNWVSFPLLLAAPVVSIWFSIFFASERADLSLRRRFLPIITTIVIVFLLVYLLPSLGFQI
mgnify:CR=1 FL=1